LLLHRVTRTGKIPGVTKPVRKHRSAAPQKRIVVVDDHPIVRERLAEILNRELDLQVCGEAEDRSTAIRVVDETTPDLVIVDLTLKNSDGLELIKDLRSRWPTILILVVSMHDESLYAERVIRAGARGYITKQEATHSIIHAVRRVFQGGVYLNERAASQLLGRLARAGNRPADGPGELLADRELQVFELTGQGLSILQIAQRLHIGAKTVETYRARIREKLHLKDASELLQSAISWVHRP
jgi:DNA-binding NarL/FixJ family response regulator